MKNYQKVLIIFVGGGAVWVLSYISSIKPELAMIISSANATIVGLVGYITGWKPTE